MRCRGNTVLCVLDGTLWGELGLGWLGCKPQFSNKSRDGCSDPERLCDAVGTPFSACSMALYGVSWVWGGLVANRSSLISQGMAARIPSGYAMPWEHRSLRARWHSMG